MHHDSYFDSVAPAIGIGAGAVADPDALAPFSPTVWLLNWQANKDCPEDERSLASVFVFVVRIEATDDAALLVGDRDGHHGHGHMVVDLGWTLQGEADAELPERVLCQTRFHHVDLEAGAEVE
eukprot:gene11938-8521_t